MITKQTKEKPLEKASAKDDWKERIKQEVFTEFNQFKKEDITYDVISGYMELAISKTEEHYRKDKETWMDKI